MACSRRETRRTMTNFLFRKNIKPCGFLLEARRAFAVKFRPKFSSRLIALAAQTTRGKLFFVVLPPFPTGSYPPIRAAAITKPPPANLKRLSEKIFLVRQNARKLHLYKCLLRSLKAIRRKAPPLPLKWQVYKGCADGLRAGFIKKPKASPRL